MSSVIYRFVKSQAAKFPYLSRFLPALDHAIARLTRGRHTLTGLLTGLPIVTLTTNGARSGRSRTVTLLGIRDGQNIVLIASNWGKTRHPDWYYNLRANPRAMLALTGQPVRSYLAREASAAERQTHWQQALDLYPRYATYARRARRQIPIVVLAPENASE